MIRAVAVMAVGYVLGAKAGRRRYEQIAGTYRAITESPKTENVWYDVDIADAETSEDVASVTFMIRAMKASSPLWS